jgi:plastocyanin
MRIVAPHHTPARSAPRPLLFAVAATLALVIAGCGEPLVKVDSSVLRLRVTEYKITPQKVQVRPGRLKIIVVNTGIVTHNVHVEADKPNASGILVAFGGTPVAHPGERVSGKVTLPPGTYKLVDTLGNHAELGDYATLIVK